MMFSARAMVEQATNREHYPSEAALRLVDLKVSSARQLSLRRSRQCSLVEIK